MTTNISYRSTIKLRMGQNSKLPHIRDAINGADLVIDQNGKIIKDRYGRVGRTATWQELRDSRFVK